MRALVTGATGFIGQNLVRRLLRDGEMVHVAVRPTTDTSVLADVADRLSFHVHDGTTEGMFRLVEAARPDIGFHIASLAISEHDAAQVEPLIRSNVLFPTQLLEAMSSLGAKRLISMGSAWQHYESRKYSPVCLYAGTKQAFNAILQFYVEVAGVAAITFRLFHAYGPGDRRPRLLPLLQRIGASGETLAMSPGKQIIDLVFVDDVIEALIGGAERLASGKVKGAETYAISSGNPISLRQLAATFAEVTGATLNIKWGERPYKPREMMEPCSMGVPLPGWTPQVSLEEGIRRMQRSGS